MLLEFIASIYIKCSHNFSHIEIGMIGMPTAPAHALQRQRLLFSAAARRSSGPLVRGGREEEGGGRAGGRAETGRLGRLGNLAVG